MERRVSNFCIMLRMIEKSLLVIAVNMIEVTIKCLQE